MNIIHERRAQRANAVLHRPFKTTGLMKFLGGLLILTALSTTVQAVQSVTLAWNPSPGTDVAGYNVYYGAGCRAYTNMVNVGKATNVTISGLVEGATYYFTATAYNTLGLESDWSNETSCSEPGLPGTLAKLQIRGAPARQFILTVTGPIGHTYDIQASPDLTAWTVIGSVTVPAGGSLDFTDANAASFPKRFYRTQ